ncbi:a-type inclusion protein [Anaeramoeba flamelloides]|uniref:A-type inclusion protein n=1 Tax=Anaeramoeba flamelloides TaxID=1746091 RepID=A0AAV7YZJ4_9EUKA|nr:a-type inclusion protein [Anaeramoeba flamelloides]
MEFIQGTKSQYTDGLVSHCTYFSLCAAQKILEEQEILPSLVDKIINSGHDITINRHTEFNEIYHLVPSFRKSMKILEIKQYPLGKMVSMIDHLVYLSKQHSHIVAVLIKPPETVCVGVQQIFEGYYFFKIFDSHPRKPMLDQASFITSNNKNMIRNHLQDLFPITHSIGGLQSEMINSIEVNILRKTSSQELKELEEQNSETKEETKEEIKEENKEENKNQEQKEKENEQEQGQKDEKKNEQDNEQKEEEDEEEKKKKEEEKTQVTNTENSEMMIEKNENEKENENEKNKEKENEKEKKNEKENKFSEIDNLTIKQLEKEIDSLTESNTKLNRRNNTLRREINEAKIVNQDPQNNETKLLQDKYQRLLEENQILKSKKRILSQNSSGKLQICPECKNQVKGQKSNFTICPHCQNSFCFVCKMSIQKSDLWDHFVEENSECPMFD